jgi:pyruvate/2-oxoglutarate dehydrogenase complex dihydrolipoamide acyltransferase (E2) component
MELLRRVRWGNVGRAAALLAVVALVVLWPRLRADPPPLPPEPRAAAELPPVDEPAPREVAGHAEEPRRLEERRRGMPRRVEERRRAMPRRSSRARRRSERRRSGNVHGGRRPSRRRRAPDRGGAAAGSGARRPDAAAVAPDAPAPDAPAAPAPASTASGGGGGGGAPSEFGFE